MSSSATIGDPPVGCTCGAWWGVVPPGPCPYHTPCICHYDGCNCPHHYTTFSTPNIVFQPAPPPPVEVLPRELTDAEIDRIARRLKELLTEDK